MWTSRFGPASHNEWVSVYWTLIRNYQLEDSEALADESQSARNKRIHVLYTEIQEEVHGPDWRAEVVQARQVRARAALLDAPSGTLQRTVRATDGELLGTASRAVAVRENLCAEGFAGKLENLQ